jgi:23S rRNA (pseudouridine1915-N3)-methyltransferase
MIWSLVAMGKTTERWIQEGTADYTRRLGHYTRFEYIELPDVKRLGAKATPEQVKAAEGEVWSKWLATTATKSTAVDHLILLDERGKSYTSMQFAAQVDRLNGRGLRHAALCIGGPYGFPEDIRNRADAFLSLGPMTFSHQMIRPFAAEQLYRAHTILKGEPYHHE